MWSDHAAILDRTLTMSSVTIQSTGPNCGWDGSDGSFQLPATASWLHCSDAATQLRRLVFVPMVDYGDGTSSSSRENSIATTASQGHGVPPVLGARDLAQQQRGADGSEILTPVSQHNCSSVSHSVEYPGMDHLFRKNKLLWKPF